MRRPRDARPLLEWPQDRSAGSAFPYRQFYPIRVVFSTLSGAPLSVRGVACPSRTLARNAIWEASLVQCPRINWTGRVLRSIGVHRCSSAANELFSRAFALVQHLSLAADEHR